MSRSLHAQPAPDFMIVVNRPVYVNYLHAVARTATFMVVGLVCLFATVALAQNEGKVSNGWLCSKAIPLGQPSTPSSVSEFVKSMLQIAIDGSGDSDWRRLCPEHRPCSLE